MLDEKPVRLTKAENYQAIHLLAPRHGVAVHINAFNFPSWGLWEKAAARCSPACRCWQAGVVDVPAQPSDGARCDRRRISCRRARSACCAAASAICSIMSIGDDVIAFTGSSDTASRIRGHRNVLARGTMVNVEADSVNAALLAPSAAPGTPVFDAFIKEVAREMTVKAGQKCTAIRRVLVPADRADAVAEALSARLDKTTLGDPRNEATRMGPVVNRAQQASVFDGIWKVANEATIVCGGVKAPKLDGIDGAKSAFVSPTLFRSMTHRKASAVNETEIFGPAATIIPYKDEAEAFALVARGGGSLVASVFGDDRRFPCARGDRAWASQRTCAGGRSISRRRTQRARHRDAAMPSRWAGRAGNGEELGGLNGLRLYHQRVAVQGSTALIARVSANAAPFV